VVANLADGDVKRDFQLVDLPRSPGQQDATVHCREDCRRQTVRVCSTGEFAASDHPSDAVGKVSLPGVEPRLECQTRELVLARGPSHQSPKWTTGTDVSTVKANRRVTPSLKILQGVQLAKQ
jgi:hypothetical protein